MGYLVLSRVDLAIPQSLSASAIPDYPFKFLASRIARCNCYHQSLCYRSEGQKSFRCRASRISEGFFDWQLLPCRVVHGCLNHLRGYPAQSNQRLSTLCCCFPSITSPLPPALIQLRFERIAQRRGDLHSPSVCSVLPSHTHLYIRIFIVSRIVPRSFANLLTDFVICDTYN